MSVESEAYEYIHPNYNIKEDKKTETDLCSEVHTYMLKSDNKIENKEHTTTSLGNESNLEIKFLDSKNRKREAVSAIFCLDGSWFYADLVNLPFIGNECMIFEADESGKVTDWSELYCNRSMDEISKENLILCINEFVQTLAPMPHRLSKRYNYG